MKTQTLSTIFALASGLHLVTATNGGFGGWGSASSFKCPANTNNDCTDTQKSSGWTWSDLSIGEFTSYDDFSFSGWTCSNSFGKRDLLTGRTFQSKCITGTASSNKGDCPSWSAPSSGSVTAMSITEMQVSVEFDCELEFHFGMDDGSNCIQKSSCSASGSTISNSQCGGATSVTVVYPGSVPGKDSCSVGVHSVGYDCSPPVTTAPVTYTATTQKTSTSVSVQVSTSVPVKATTLSTLVSSTSTPVLATSSSVLVKPTTSSSVEATTSSAAVTSSAPVVPVVPSSSVPVIVGTTAKSNFSSTAIVSSTSVAPVTTSIAVPVTTPVAIDTSATPVVTSVAISETITTEVVLTTVTTCPVTSTKVSGGSTTVVTSIGVSTVFVTSTATFCPVCEASSTAIAASSPIAVPTGTASVSTLVTSVVAGSSPVAVSTEVATTEVGVVPTKATTVAIGATTTVTSVTTETAPCPQVLPSCLNTWLFQTGCGSNTDADCFCPQEVFVTNVFSCLSAHGASSEEIAQAQSYFQGICAPAIPNNPAIIVAATTFTALSTVTVATTIPVTTYGYSTVIVYPVTQTAGPSQGATITGSSTTVTISTIITVPQVVFQTVTASGSASGGIALLPAPTTTAAVSTAVSVGAVGGTTAAPVTASAGIQASKTTASLKVSSTTGGPIFTGAAQKVDYSFGGMAAAAVMAAALL